MDMYVCMYTLNYFMLIWKLAVIELSKETQSQIITCTNLIIILLQTVIPVEWRETPRKQPEEESLALRSNSQEQQKSLIGIAVEKSFNTPLCKLFIVLIVREFIMHLSLKKNCLELNDCFCFLQMQITGIVPPLNYSS